MMIVPAMLITLAATPVAYCIQDQAQEERLRAMMLESVEKAFQEHVGHLFDIWMKQQAETPDQFARGGHIAVEGYLRAKSAIDRWKPKRC
jgi:hypothetical protein